MCDNSSYKTIPLEPVPPGAYNATMTTSTNDHQEGASRPYAAEDYGYQAYISSTSEQPTTSDGTGFPANSYGYYATLSKYAPEEPALLGNDSFTGYAPAPPSFQVTYSVPAETVYSAPFSDTHGDVDMREGNTVLCAKKSESSSSQLDCSHLSSRSQSSMDEDSNDGLKSSTAKKIKSLPLPKVGLPPRQAKSKSEKFKEYVGEVARLNEEIERLQKLQEQLRQEAKKIVGTAADDVLPQGELLDESTTLTDLTEDTAPDSSITRKDAPAPKRKKMKEEVVSKKEKTRPKRVSASPSESPDRTPESDYLRRRLFKKEVESKPTKDPINVEASSSAPSNSTEDKETSPEVVVATKKRIAREGVG
ncbi:hypothetical protein COOONC_20590 [Cooperia oncophora]